MKMQKFSIFVKNNLQINMLNINTVAKIRTVVIMQVNTEALHIAYVI